MKKKQTTSESSAVPGLLRLYLYLTAAITGAAVMIVEILGAKMLAPYFGTSHFVWTAQIAVTLVALSAGYYAGGKWVDQSSRLGRLYSAIAIAALYLLLGVLMLEPVAYACFRFKLAVGSLVTAAFLFFVPLALLAMVGPFLIRVLTVSLSGVGSNAGRLAAISTLGSFGGTVLIGYVLIPLLPNSRTMVFTSLALMALATIYFFAFHKSGKARGVAAAGLIAALLAAGVAFKQRPTQPPRMVELFRGNSNFGLLQVMETTNGMRRYYMNDYLTQNTYDPHEKKSLSVFTYALHGLARSYTAQISNVLCIGLGIGVVPMLFAGEGAAVDVVEINPAVVPVAVQYFGLEPARLHIEIDDGRAFLNRAKLPYDAIVLDAFLGDSSPSHLLTREAFGAMRRVLKPEGTLVINCFADFTPGRDFFGASLDKTLKSVFQSVKIHDAGNGNVFFVASNRRTLAMINPVNLDQVHISCRHLMDQTLRAVVGTVPDRGIILTDNYNPLEYYDAENRERIRRYLALSFKTM